MAVDETLKPQLTGQFLSAATFFGHDNVPQKYKEQYLSYDQNKNSSILSGSVHEMFMCKLLSCAIGHRLVVCCASPAQPANLSLANYNPDNSSPLRSPYYHPGGHSGQPAAYFQACGADMVRDVSQKFPFKTHIALAGCGFKVNHNMLSGPAKFRTPAHKAKTTLVIADPLRV